MLDVTPSNLAQEIRAAEAATESHHKHLDEQIRRYHGPGYKITDSGPEGDYHRENHAFDWVSLILPKLVFNNPRVRVGTRLQQQQSIDADAVHHGLNRWIMDNNPRRFLVEGPALDMQFTYGVGMVSQEPVPFAKPVEGIGAEGSKGKPYSPRWYHIPPTWYVQDPLALSREQVRFKAHRVVRDKDDLIALAKEDPDTWNLDVIESLAVDQGAEELGRLNSQESVRRSEVVYWQVWVPEYELDDSPGSDKGFHGTWFYLPSEYPAGDERAGFIREPTPYFGHRSGPYQVFGAYNVPMDPVPLGSLTATLQQERELNKHASTLSRSMADYKRLILVLNCDNQMQQIIKDGEHDYVFDGNMDPDGRIEQVEIAGGSDQMLQHLALLQERLQRLSGLNDAQRGLVSGRGTATENAIADAASDVRIGWLKQQIDEAVIGMLRKTAFYLWRDERVAFPLGPEIAEQMGAMLEPVLDPAGNPRMDSLGQPLMAPPEAWFRGGPANPEAQFEDLELTIEPYSMERTSQAVLERNAQLLLQLATNVFPLIPQVPGAKWKELFERIGDAYNIPDLDELVSEEMMFQMAGMPPQMAGPSPSGTGPQLAPQPPQQRYVSGGGPRSRGAVPSAAQPSSNGSPR